MTVAPAKPRLPLATFVIGVAGIAGVVGGIVLRATSRGCIAQVCDRSSTIGYLLIVWGVVAAAVFVRGRAGLFALVAAIVLPLAVSWRFFFPVLAWLVVALMVVNASKEQLGPYYRPRRGVA